MMRFIAFAAVIALIAGGYGYSLLRSFNHFETVERAFSGQCKPVQGLAGPEDLQIDPVRRRAFISSFDRRAESARNPRGARSARGAIHVFDLDDPLSDTGWRDRTGGVPAAFRPRGLYFYRDGDIERLFVVNDANHGVEIFDVDENGDLVHLETFTERRLTSPNDVVAVGPRSFYVTNDVKSGRDGALASMLFLMRLRAGEVLFTNGTVWQVAASDLRFANGINISPDGATLYVAETAGGAVQVYDRDQVSGRLQPSQTIDIDGAPDNINVDEAGALWIGALPKPLTVPKHGKDASFLAPSQVVRIGPEGGETDAVYRDTGEEISAATSAARLGSTLLIGSLFDNKFLICNLPPETN